MSKPYISYVDPATMKDRRDARRSSTAARSYGTPRPESQAIRAHVPAVFWSFANSWRDVFHTGVADHGIKELCRLYVSRSVLCEFCGNQRSIKAAKAGDVIEDQTKDLINFEASTRYSDKQKAALSYAEAITWDLPVDDKFWARLHKHFSEPELVEIGYFIALTMGQQRWLRTLNIEHHQILAGEDGSMAPGFETEEALKRSKAAGGLLGEEEAAGPGGGVIQAACNGAAPDTIRHEVVHCLIRGPAHFDKYRVSGYDALARREDTEALLPRRLRQRHDHVELDARAGRRELVDAHRRAGRQPVAEIGRHGLVHGVGLAEVGEIFRHLDDVAPGRALAVEDRLDRVHRVLGLLLDRMRMDVLVILVRMVVVERRRGRARQEHQVAGADDLDRRRVGHLVRLRRIGMDGFELEGR